MSAEYERQVLGCAFLDSSLIDGERIPESLFADSKNRTIWRTMLELSMAGSPVDILTVTEGLNGSLEAVGGPFYVSKLSDVTCSAANAQFYIDKLRETSRQAAIKRLLLDIADKQKRGLESDGLISALEAGLLDVRRKADTSMTIKPSDALKEILDAAEERVRTGATGPNGIPTRFSVLDSMTGGFQRGDLVLISARTSIGKSALALSFIEKQIASGMKVALASLEMSAIQIWQRLLSMRSLVNTGKLRFNHMNGDDLRALVASAAELRDSGLSIIDRSDLTAGAIRSWATQMVAEGCSILYVDYVGLVRGTDNGAPRWEQIGEVSRSLKAIARELRIPVVALVQLNRDAADHGEPGLHNLRDSGSLEQDADVVMMLVRSEKEEVEDTVPAKLLIKKQRNGPTGRVDLLFRKSLTQFREGLKESARV